MRDASQRDNQEDHHYNSVRTAINTSEQRLAKLLRPRAAELLTAGLDIDLIVERIFSLAKEQISAPVGANRGENAAIVRLHESELREFAKRIVRRSAPPRS